MPLTHTEFQFPYPQEVRRGKVRDVYHLAGQVVVLVATDRVSAFDVVLDKPIPHKGQVLTELAAFFLQATGTVAPNYLLACPHPHVLVGVLTQPYPIEVVVRGYLAGHAWRTYHQGGRMLCGVPLPEGLREADPLPEPIVTPTTKSAVGHDIDISEEEILRAGLLTPEHWAQIKHWALLLYEAGAARARERDLILVDTKYEFGETQGRIFLIDELHTPDSSRYYQLEGYAERQRLGQPQVQLSKEFVREWLMAQGFQGQEGAAPPPLTPAFVEEVSQRYIGLYEQMTGHTFYPAGEGLTEDQLRAEIFAATCQALRQIGL